MQISQGNGRFNIALPYENLPTGESKYREGKRERETGEQEGHAGSVRGKKEGRVPGEKEWKKYDRLLPRERLLSPHVLEMRLSRIVRADEEEKRNAFDHDYKHRYLANSYLSARDADYARACIETCGGTPNTGRGQANAAECTLIIRATYFLARASKDAKYV